MLRLRTFSKAYGLAGARIGYALGAPEIIASFDKIRNHFGINKIGQAGALAALEDDAYLQEVRSRVAAGREQIGRIAAAHDMTPLPSATNFVTVDAGGDGAFGGTLGFGGGSFACLLRLIDAVVCCAVDARRERSAPGSSAFGGSIIFFFGMSKFGDRREAARRRA